MVLDAHAQCVDQDGDHNPPVEVLALHNPLQLVAKGLPKAGESVPLLRFLLLLFLLLVPLLLDLVSLVPMLHILGELVDPGIVVVRLVAV